MGRTRMGEKQNNVSEARIAIEKFKIKDHEGNTHTYIGNVHEEIEATAKRAKHHIETKENNNVDNFNSIFEESFM